MLGPNPKKAATPSTANSTPSSSGSDSTNNTGDGLMVKAIDDIFEKISSSENPQEFRVSIHNIHNTILRGSKVLWRVNMKIYAESLNG